MSGVVEKVKAKVDQVLHKDGAHSGTHTAGTTGTHGTHTAGTHTGTHGTHTGTTGTHTGTHTAGTGIGGHSHSTNAGPHDSNVANKLDPRVDSDRDGKNLAQQEATGYGGTHTGTHGTHSSGIHPAGTTHSTTGPHSSNLANKLDPRVNSDGSYSGTGTHGTHNTHSGTGIGGSHTGTGIGGSHSTNAGPHDSNAANKLDPRVDSDRDGHHLGQGQAQGLSQSAGYGSTGTAQTGGYGSTGTGIGGTHTGTGIGGTHGGIGGAQHTAGTGLGSSHTGTGLGGSHSTNAGPHDSNIANKLDPRVDSDRDGANLGQRY